LDRARAGSNIAAKMAMMAITTSNSIRVNALSRRKSSEFVGKVEGGVETLVSQPRSSLAWHRDRTIYSGNLSYRRANNPNNREIQAKNEDYCP
jgi:hypothetical protein